MGCPTNKNNFIRRGWIKIKAKYFRRGSNLHRSHSRFSVQRSDNSAWPLADIYQRSFNDGVIPKEWNLANISSIFKKGKKSDAGNYRPVSLTSVPCKVMKTIIKKSLATFLDDKSEMSKLQHGFTKGRLCLTNLLESFEAWTRLLEAGYGVDIIYLDYRKAFDTVHHGRLIDHLKSYRVVRRITRWVKEFLSQRKMRVGVQGSFSEWVDVLSDVPQGSVLRPLLFLIFGTDLPNWVSNSMQMFTDDTKLWRWIHTVGDSLSLQEDLHKLIKWSDKWLLRFNPEKCKVMHVGHNVGTEYHMMENGEVRSDKGGEPLGHLYH